MQQSLRILSNNACCNTYNIYYYYDCAFNLSVRWTRVFATASYAVCKSTSAKKRFPH